MYPHSVLAGNYARRGLLGEALLIDSHWLLARARETA